MKAKVSNSEPSSFGRGLILFIRYHASQIKQGGLPVLLRKVKEFLLLLLSIPVVLVVRALRPLVLIRFKPLPSKLFGSFLHQTELYLCWRDAGLEKKRTFDVFYHNGQPCNTQLKKMWDRRLHVSRFAEPVAIVNHFIPGGKSHVIPWPTYNDVEIHLLLPRTPAYLSFTPEEERLGRDGLQAMGIPEGTLFVCFHQRDSKYKEFAQPEVNASIYSYRNSDIHNHIPAAEEMTRRGYYAIRMGAIVKEPLQTTNPMIIDYATNYRSDFMDIYLCAKCYFYIGDDSGLWNVPAMFRRPVAMVNEIPIGMIHTRNPDDLCIFKKLWLREEHRFLTFRNIFDGEFNDFEAAELYEQAGIELVQNTAEEITALAVEMDERLKGTWQTTEEDEELQQRFWSLFKPTVTIGHRIIRGRIGADFLRQNQELLD